MKFICNTRPLYCDNFPFVTGLSYFDRISDLVGNGSCCYGHIKNLRALDAATNLCDHIRDVHMGLRKRRDFDEGAIEMFLYHYQHNSETLFYFGGMDLKPYFCEER